jgi:DNA-nicking Smr family endonuclease
MAERRLSAEESEIWQRVAATVRKMEGARATPPAPVEAVKPKRLPIPQPMPTAKTIKAAPAPADTLDGGWDRRLRRGIVQPERTIDLHGHTLASAHAALDHGIERAIVDDVRVILLITGRAPKGEAPHRRGLIRAAIGDWLAASRHAPRIAAVRGAHPRHGGEGALYLILRRTRE